MKLTLNPSIALIAAIAALLALHLFRLQQIPGLHFDEAWAMNFSATIGKGSHWPITAMSPYTAPWAHYWAAIWMNIFGASLFVFRASQLALALSGLIFLGLALPERVRAPFAGALFLIPGLAMNHRFAIELNGWHALAFGLFCWALQKEKYSLATLAALAGTTAHILFYAPMLALLAASCLEGISISAQARKGALLYFGLMALFFGKICLEIPEKGKALALVASCLAAALFLFLEGEKWRFWRSLWWRRALLMAGIVFVANGIFFAEGLWSAAVAGRDLPPAFFLAAAWILFLAITFFATKNIPSWLRTWWLAGAFLLGLMMLKPAPRYFELFFLGLAVVWAWGFLSQSHRWRWISGLALLLHSLVVYSVYFSPLSKEHSLRFLFFKDSSRDFLDSQALARFLGSSGCALSDIHTNDPRIFESLRALSYGDWPVEAKPCEWNYVTRKANETVGEAWGEFLLRRKN